MQTMLEWAKTMTWKGIRPIIDLNQKVYEKGVKLTEKAMKEIEKRLERNHLLPKWDIHILPILKGFFLLYKSPKRDTIEHLASQFMSALRTLIAHCQSPETGGYTPSYFSATN